MLLPFLELFIIVSFSQHSATGVILKAVRSRPEPSGAVWSRPEPSGGAWSRPEAFWQAQFLLIADWRLAFNDLSHIY